MSAHVILIGRIGRLGEVKTAAESGTNYLGFTIATSTWVPGRGGSDGFERTTWWHARIFGRQVEKLSTNLQVGDLVEVRGEAELEPWKTNAGEDRQSLNVKADAVRRLTARSTTTVRAAPAAPQPSATPAPDRDAPPVAQEEPPF